MRLEYATVSEIGNRETNEDRIAACRQEEKSLFAVCDGLGGHGLGDEAASVVAGTFREEFEKAGELSDFLGRTFTAAQEALQTEQGRRHALKKMKTTAAVLAADRKNAYIGHVGDSRVYVFRHDRVKCRTLDHSIPQMLALSGEIKESEIRNHPDRNVVLRVMGVEWEKPMYELMAPIPLKKCQAFLLCSDGFWELIDEKEMCRLLKQTTSALDWVKSMTAVVEEAGKGRDMDNYSAIAVRCV